VLILQNKLSRSALSLCTSFGQVLSPLWNCPSVDNVRMVTTGFYRLDTQERNIIFHCTTDVIVHCKSNRTSNKRGLMCGKLTLSDP